MYYKSLVRPKPINLLNRNQVKKEKKERKKRSRDFCFLALFIVTGFLFILPACGDDKPKPKSKSQEKKVEAIIFFLDKEKLKSIESVNMKNYILEKK